MKDHLYIVHHTVDDRQMNFPCVGDEDLQLHARMTEHLGIPLNSVTDIESELSILLRSCFHEGLIRGWWRQIAYDR